jgi:hypothetical protein
MLTTIIGWLTSGVVSSIVSEISTLWTSYLTAQTNEQRAEIMERIKALHAVRDVQVAEAGNKVTAWLRGIAAAPFLVYVWKLILWDKIVLAGTGTTDDLSPHLWYLALVVYGFLFLHWTIGQWKA